MELFLGNCESGSIRGHIFWLYFDYTGRFMSLINSLSKLCMIAFMLCSSAVFAKTDLMPLTMCVFDFVGNEGPVHKAMKEYKGAMIVVSHVDEFVKQIDIAEVLDLGV